MFKYHIHLTFFSQQKTNALHFFLQGFCDIKKKDRHMNDKKSVLLENTVDFIGDH